MAQNGFVGECSHYATTDLVTAFSPWPLESLAPGKVRQDRVNGQRPKAASIFVVAGLEAMNRVEVVLMALRLHQVRQSLVLVQPSTGSKQRWPKLQFGYQRQRLQVRDPVLPIRAVELES